MEMKERLLHSCTLNNDVHQLLLEYIKENDVEELRNLLEEERVDVNYVYNDSTEFIYENRTPLQISCAYFADETSEECIQLLLDYGADVLLEDPESEKNSLNFAVESGNVAIVETILKFIKKKQLNIINSNAIYLLVKYVKDVEESEEKFVKILKLLLESDIDINYENENGWTAIYIAARFKFKNFVKTMIEFKKDEINLDDFKDSKGKTARNLIREANLYPEDKLPEISEENSNVTVKTLNKNIRNRSVEDFEKNFENIQHLTEIDKYKLLQLAVKFQAEKIVSFLLSKDVKYDGMCFMTNDNPLVVASQRGFHRIVRQLVFKKPRSELVSKALFELLKIPYTSEQTDDINYQKCLTFLLKSEKLEINYKDINENTALHYSLRYQDPEMSLKILQKGASLASKDSFNRLAIADIDATTLETHLNDCIQYENKESAKGDDACLLINFTTLLPVKSKNEQEDTEILIESQTDTDNSNLFSTETEVLQYMCKSKQLKQYLKHPVILAFLYLKWHRIRVFFYINFFLYLLFLTSLFSYITFGYNIQSKIALDISYVILLITFIFLVVRELSQLIIFRFRYFLAFENWLEISLLISTAGILTEHSNETLMRQFSAVAIVAAAIEFLLLVGQFPSMSTNIMMLRTVSYTFFKLLLWYSILILAFAYSFYTLFQETNEVVKNSTIVDEDEEQDFFVDPGMSLLKTIVMLTGEFDAASIKFNSYPIISQIIFVLFVFLIAIVLFNLLNGLAVSDTQIIKNDAKLYGQILRVEHISHIERVLLTNRLIKWLPAVKYICLFPMKTKKAEILIYPNQNSKVVLRETEVVKNQEKQVNCFRILFEVCLDKKTERALILLMKEKKEESVKKKDELLLTKVESLENLIKTLINKQ